VSSASAYTSRDVAVGSYALHLSEGGDARGAPVMWLHGSGPGVTSLSNWEHTIAALPQYRNLCPDMLGFGDSTHPDPPPNGMAAWTLLRAETIVGLMDALGIEKAHFVGNSMGGMITTNVLKRWPERVDKFVLMASGGAPLPPGPGLMNVMTYYQDPTAERLRDMLAQFVYDKPRFADTLSRITSERLATTLREDVKRSHLTTFKMPDGPREPMITEADLGKIDHEALVLHGREDQIVPLGASYWLAERLPNAQLHVFPHTGHWIQIESAKRFEFLVDAHLRGTL